MLTIIQRVPRLSAACAMHFRIKTPYSRRLVGDKSATSRRLVADHFIKSETDLTSTAIGRRSVADLSAIGRRPIGDQSPTGRRLESFSKYGHILVSSVSTATGQLQQNQSRLGRKAVARSV